MFIDDQIVTDEETCRLRDHFAGLARQIADARDTPFLGAKKELGLDRDVESDGVIHWPKLIAKRAYIIADAMIAARKEQA